MSTLKNELAQSFRLQERQKEKERERKRQRKKERERKKEKGREREKETEMYVCMYYVRKEDDMRKFECCEIK